MSPFVTVGLLTVLWLIVVVPMVVRRSDEMARERSVRQFGRAMRALGRRPHIRGEAGGATAAPVTSGHEVFVAGGAGQDPHRPSAPDLATRRPVPATAVQQSEALMHPVDRSEMSAARAAMMARRRRSLAVLGIGSLVTSLFALIEGGAIWLLALMFLAGLGGYLFFLRAQALKDRERRADRRDRLAPRTVTRSYDVSAEPDCFTELDDTVVRIDDDDIRLQTMDTIDLTGLYPQEEQLEPAPVRRAS